MFPQVPSLTSSAEARTVSERNLVKCEYPRIWATLTDLAQRERHP
jgi:hypothetical protein